MASWVITMSKDYPQHWEIAKQHGFWDMTARRPIQTGDDVYFWLAGGSFLGRTRATSDAREVTSADVPPWEDTGERTYTWRFTFELLSGAPLGQPKWGEVVEEMTNPRMTLHGPRRFDNPHDEHVLASYFEPAPATSTGSVLEDVPAGPIDAYPEQERTQDLARFEDDLRRYISRAIAMREGQPQFRQSLLETYGRTCAVTGTTAVYVLEAAHIAAYKGQQSNETHNGLLLRADIHTLFDRHLLTVLPDHTIKVSPQLRGTEYEHFEGQPLATVPPSTTARPSRELLQQHNADCGWLDNNHGGGPPPTD